MSQTGGSQKLLNALARIISRNMGQFKKLECSGGFNTIKDLLCFRYKDTAHPVSPGILCIRVQRKRLLQYVCTSKKLPCQRRTDSALAGVATAGCSSHHIACSVCIMGRSAETDTANIRAGPCAYRGAHRHLGFFPESYHQPICVLTTFYISLRFFTCSPVNACA